MAQWVPDQPTRLQILAALRELADQRTLREVNGRRVADIIPHYGKGYWSLNRTVARKLGLPIGTVSRYMTLLCAQRLVRRGEGTRRIRRWVVMSDE